MTWFVAKIAFSAAVISFTSWLAGRRPGLAGFLLALPLTTMLALLLNYAEYRDASKSVAFAKSVFFAVPLSLTFFLPFLLADRIRAPFWALYLGGVGLLGVGYALHSALVE